MNPKKSWCIQDIAFSHEFVCLIWAMDIIYDYYAQKYN